MLAGLCLLLFADAGHSQRNAYGCAAIEYNEVVGEEGRATLRQVILWDWHEDRQRLHVTHFSIVQRPPCVMRSGTGWRTWITTESGPRLVEAASYQRTRTEHDPEIEDRAHVACERRRGLR